MSNVTSKTLPDMFRNMFTKPKRDAEVRETLVLNFEIISLYLETFTHTFHCKLYTNSPETQFVFEVVLNENLRMSIGLN